MMPAGWFFLAVCWGVIIAVTLWCFYKVLAAPLKS